MIRVVLESEKQSKNDQRENAFLRKFKRSVLFISVSASRYVLDVSRETK